VGAIVAGFLCHPVLTWVVDKLEASRTRVAQQHVRDADDRQRAAGRAGGLAVLLGLVRLPFINLLPLLISVAASLVMVFLLFSWFRYFGVVQWFEYVILGLVRSWC